MAMNGWLVSNRQNPGAGIVYNASKLAGRERDILTRLKPRLLSCTAPPVKDEGTVRHSWLQTGVQQSVKAGLLVVLCPWLIKHKNDGVAIAGTAAAHTQGKPKASSAPTPARF